MKKYKTKKSKKDDLHKNMRKLKQSLFRLTKVIIKAIEDFPKTLDI